MSVKIDQHDQVKLISFKCPKFNSDALMFRANIFNMDKSKLFRKLVREFLQKSK